jgi:hypothetical protein
MAITNFIPSVWTAALLQRFASAQVVIPYTNQSYTGEVKVGNTVNVTSITTPTIVDYAAASRTITAAALTDARVQLLINQEKAFSFFVDDIDEVQSAGGFEDVTRDSGAALAEDAESYVIAQALANGTSAGTAAITTPDLAYAAIVAMRTALAKAKVPVEDRILAVNPEWSSFLLGAASKLTTVPQAGDGELRNGVIGRLLGFTVIETPLITNASKPAAFAFHKSAIGFAQQISNVEALRHQTKFADIVRGLSVYGAKVIRPTAVQTYISL